MIWKFVFTGVNSTTDLDSFPFALLHSVSLGFRLRLRLRFSVNGQMAIRPHTSHLNYHSAIYTQNYETF